MATAWTELRHRAQRLGSPRCLAALAGLLIGTSCASPLMWPLALAALVLWCSAAVRDQRPVQRLQVIAIGAATWSVAGMPWVMAAVRLDSDIRILWQLATLAVVAAHHALCLLCAWWLAERLTRRTDKAWINAWRWCCAVTWGEYLQQLGWFGHGYASLAVALVDVPNAEALLPVLGSLGWSALLSLACACAAMALVAPTQQSAAPARWVWGACATALIGMPWAGAAAWPSPALPAVATAPTPVLVLQARRHKLAQWTPEVRDESVALLQAAMLEVPRGGVVVTPETYFAGVPPGEVAGQWADLMDLASQRSITALIGMPNVFRDEEGLHGMNSVTQLAPGRVSVYGKERLVPFAEYLPWPVVLGFFYRHVFASAREQELPAPPELRRPLFVQGRSVGVVICHELSFSRTVVERARESDWLVSLSDDGWVGQAAYLDQMLSITRVRARETGKPVLRVATGGPSYLVDHQGQVLASSSASSPTTLLMRVTPRPGSSTFVAHAAVLPWLYLLLLLGPVLALQSLAGHQQRRSRPEARL